MNNHGEPQRVPVKIYQSDGRLTVAAPLPGLEPGDITVEITPGNQLVIHGNGRGLLKGQTLVLLDEWNPGPYCRELALPSPVDGSMANITFRNGILVVALPLAGTTRPAHLALDDVGPDYGERAGNAGHPVRRLSEAEHVARTLGHHQHHL
jgi:HSP20 family protein